MRGRGKCVAADFTPEKPAHLIAEHGGVSGLQRGGMTLARPVAEPETGLRILRLRPRHRVDGVVSRRLERRQPAPRRLEEFESPPGSRRLVAEVLARAHRREVGARPRQYEEPLPPQRETLPAPQFGQEQLQRVQVDARLRAGDRKLVRVGVSPAIRVGLDLADREFGTPPVVADGEHIQDEHGLGQHDTLRDPNGRTRDDRGTRTGAGIRPGRQRPDEPPRRLDGCHERRKRPAVHPHPQIGEPLRPLGEHVRPNQFLEKPRPLVAEDLPLEVVPPREREYGLTETRAVSEKPRHIGHADIVHRGERIRLAQRVPGPLFKAGPSIPLSCPRTVPQATSLQRVRRVCSPDPNAPFRLSRVGFRPRDDD